MSPERVNKMKENLFYNRKVFSEIHDVAVVLPLNNYIDKMFGAV